MLFATIVKSGELQRSFVIDPVPVGLYSIAGAGLLGNSVAPYLSESLIVKFHFFHLELRGLFMWLIFLCWLIKSSDHSIEITLFCEDWQAVIKLNSIVLPISTFLMFVEIA
ncbi:hypothetical protein SLEP1_g22749 [Rubroshorea leprosula]|uniref:Uncharacterized protein n=1 Tax=Rubroshorea leprosula TaxID=152421 RepID=A0AAV5JIY7_9ROSI|nr:hypothetical protein SLEP1_g22749 [Rubroshorea leprosula]